MKSVKITDALSELSELVDKLPATGDVVILNGDKAVARLTTPNGKPSLRDIESSSVGSLLRPLFGADDDLLGEMTSR